MDITIPNHCGKQMLLLGTCKSTEGNWCWEYYCEVCGGFRAVKMKEEEVADQAGNMGLKKCANCGEFFSPVKHEKYCTKCHNNHNKESK